MVNSNESLSVVFTALSDPTRRAIIARLAERPRTVGELATPFDMSLAAVSKHLAVLDRAGLIHRARRGRRIECTLQPRSLKAVSDWVADYERFWTERLEAMEKAIQQRRRKKP